MWKTMGDRSFVRFCSCWSFVLNVHPRQILYHQALILTICLVERKRGRKLMVRKKRKQKKYSWIKVVLGPTNFIFTNVEWIFGAKNLKLNNNNECNYFFVYVSK